MIADGDSAARNAFCVGLREDALAATTVSATQELDPNDILEVEDMAEAIARAEKIVTAPRSSQPAVPRSSQPADIFDRIGQRRTDDTTGAATPAPLAVVRNPTLLIRPKSVSRRAGSTSAFPPAAPQSVGRTGTALPAPAATVEPSEPSQLAPEMPAPMLLEEDAYFHPVGQMRALADASLDGIREPTLLLRARTRRKHFSTILVAALLPLVVLAAIAVFARDEVADASPPPTTTAATNATTNLAPTTTISTATMAMPAVETPQPAAVPVFDVKNLPTAGRRRTSATYAR